MHAKHSLSENILMLHIEMYRVAQKVTPFLYALTVPKSRFS